MEEAAEDSPILAWVAARDIINAFMAPRCSVAQLFILHLYILHHELPTGMRIQLRPEHSCRPEKN